MWAQFTLLSYCYILLCAISKQLLGSISSSKFLCLSVCFFVVVSFKACVTYKFLMESWCCRHAVERPVSALPPNYEHCLSLKVIVDESQLLSVSGSVKLVGWVSILFSFVCLRIFCITVFYTIRRDVVLCSLIYFQARTKLLRVLPRLSLIFILHKPFKQIWIKF